MDQSIAHQFPNLFSNSTAVASARKAVFTAVLIATTALLAVGWFVPVMLQGGDQLSKTAETRNQVADSVSQFLTRQTDGNKLGLKGGDINVLYATPKYFQIAGKAAQAAAYAPDQYFVFIINEEIHEGELPLSPPDARLRIVGEQEYLPESSPEVLIDSYHHRSSLVRFPVTDPQGRSILADAASLELLLTEEEKPDAIVSTKWELPIAYSEQFERGVNMNLGTLLALVAGLLASLSPCLAQLTACYLSTLAGVGVSQVGENSSVVRRRVFRTALLFVAGFTFVYTLAGGVAGWAGQTIQSSGLLVKWSGPLSIAAGVMLLAMGLWVALNSRAPLVCKLPMPRFMQVTQSSGVFAPMVLGFSFAIGCATCFSGALFAALLLYLGTTATALQGATILFIFSLGIAIPYLFAAATLTQALPLLERLGRASPMIGLVSGMVIFVFGMLMLTGNFHAVSDEVYLGLRWMSLLK